jgi:hypothetical protein
MKHEELIKRLEVSCLGLDPIDPLRLLVDDVVAALAQPEQEPVAWETVYETIIHWDEGGGKRSRRELAQRIIDLYTAPPAQPPQRKPMTDEQRKDLMNKAWNKWLGGEDDNHTFAWHFSFEVEAAHNIKE